jgi:hypothetical protein
MREINGIVFHHSATSPPDSSDGQRLYEMSIEPEHLKSRGILSKAEYHYIIARNGRLIRCAPDMALLGHCGSVRNHDTIGICSEGNLLYQHLTRSQLKTLLALTTTLVRQYGIRLDQLLRHKDVMATACPGLNFPHPEIVAEVGQALKLQPDRWIFRLGSREMRLEYTDAVGFEVIKTIPQPCSVKGGNAFLTSNSAKTAGLPTSSNGVFLRSLEADGFKVEFKKTTREVVLSRRE